MCSQPHINYLYINLYIYLYIFKYIYLSVARNVFPPSPKIFLSVPFSLPLLSARDQLREGSETRDRDRGIAPRRVICSFDRSLSLLSFLFVPSCAVVYSASRPSSALFSSRFCFVPSMASSRIRCTQRRRSFHRQTLVLGRCRRLLSENSCLVNKSGARSTNLRSFCPFTTVLRPSSLRRNVFSIFLIFSDLSFFHFCF